MSVTRLTILALAVVAAGCRPPTTLQVSGTIETDEAHVASRYGGRVVKLFAAEGAVLQPGQLIVELDATELRARRDAAAAALADLAAGARTNELIAARQSWEAVQAELEYATAEARRARELFAEKNIAESELDSARSRADALEKRAAAAKAQFDLLVEGARPERIAQARAQLAELDAQLREMQITAPTASTLEVLNVKVGDVLPANREVATLLLTGHLWVRVFVPEPWLGRIQLGQHLELTTDAFPSEKLTGVIEQISRQAEFTPRNVQTNAERIKQVYGVKLRLTDEKLRAGMYADVVFPR